MLVKSAAPRALVLELGTSRRASRDACQTHRLGMKEGGFIQPRWPHGGSLPPTLPGCLGLALSSFHQHPLSLVDQRQDAVQLHLCNGDQGSKALVRQQKRWETAPCPGPGADRACLGTLANLRGLYAHPGGEVISGCLINYL